MELLIKPQPSAKSITELCMLWEGNSNCPILCITQCKSLTQNCKFPIVPGIGPRSA